MCTPHATVATAKPTPRQTADAATAAFNAHDVSAVAALYHPDVVLVTPDAGELKGREQAAEYQRAFMQGFPDGKVETVAMHDAGNTTIDEWVFHGTNTGALPLPSGETLPATRKRISLRGIDVAVHKGSAIAAHRVYFDQVELLTQLGLMPEA